MARKESFNRIWASAADQIASPSDTRVSTGHEGGAEKAPPLASDQNYMQNRSDEALHEIEQYGALLWFADVTYAVGAMVHASDGNYISLKDGNKGNDPTKGGSFWAKQESQQSASMIPVGVPQPWPTDTPPDGWLVLNGQTITAAEYPILFSIYGANLPDMRGYFIRGKDDERDVLSTQDDQVGQHNHAVDLTAASAGAHTHTGTTDSAGEHSHTYNDGLNQTDNNSKYSGGNVSFGLKSNTSTDGDHTHKFTTASAGAHTHGVKGNTANSGGDETRPKNIAFNYIVRAA